MHYVLLKRCFGQVWIHENVLDFPDHIPANMMRTKRKKGFPGRKRKSTHIIKKLIVKTGHSGHGKLTSRDRCYRIGYSTDLELALRLISQLVNNDLP